MNGLDHDWFLQPSIDFEGKSYTLLAWLQGVDHAFANKELLPWRNELELKEEILHQFLRGMADLADVEKGDLKGVNTAKWELDYAHHPVKDEYLITLEKIAKWSIPLLHTRCRQFQEMELEIEYKTALEPIGVEPINPEEGFVLFPRSARVIRAFQFKRSALYQATQDESLSISTTFAGDFFLSLSESLSRIKMKLWEHSGKRAMAAYYLNLDAGMYPEESTVLPIARKKLWNHLK